MVRLRAQGRCRAEHRHFEAPPQRQPSSTVVEVFKNGRTRHRLQQEAQGADAATPARPAPPPRVVGEDGPLAAARSFFLPRGWPDSVTEDYLSYQLYTVPAHITGSLSHSLATSSMITALAVGSGPAATVGIAAAIKWITKDGLGAVGRLAAGGRLSSYFDEDPKRWRMIAELITTAGLALEIATQIWPANFVVLAGAGTLAKATAKGIGRPCFRVVQTHFAATNNVGDVAAKEEVWEVCAQLVGLAASVGALGALEAADAQAAVVPLWVGVHAIHVGLRYYSLAQLHLPWPNAKRAGLLVTAHVGGGAVPGVAEANRREPMLPGPGTARPAVKLGCSVDAALAWLPLPGGGDESSSGSSSGSSRSNGSSSSDSGSSATLHHSSGGGSNGLGRLLELYATERYALVWRGGVARVLLWQDAGPLDLLRATWQAAWLDAHAPRAGAAAGASASMAALEKSLAEMQRRFPDFEERAEAAGWHLERTVLLAGATRLQPAQPQA